MTMGVLKMKPEHVESLEAALVGVVLPKNTKRLRKNALWNVRTRLPPDWLSEVYEYCTYVHIDSALRAIFGKSEAPK